MSNLLKFDGPRIDDLLERVRRELGTDVTIIEANRTRKGGVGGFFAREWFEVLVDAPAHALAAGPDSQTEQPAEETDPFLAMALAVDDVREPARAIMSPAEALRSAPAPTSALPSVDRERQPSFEMALATAQREAVIPSTQSASTVMSPSATVPVMAPPALVAGAAVPPPRTRRLRDLDLADLLGHLDRIVPETLLPTGAAPTIAVVGDPSSVRHVAASLARRLGLEDSDVVVASPAPVDVAPWLALTAPDQVAARTARWRAGGRPTVVAVELSPGLEGHGWAAAMLEALGADQVRLVAKAWQLSDQLDAKAAALGGVDGIDLVEIDAAAEPELFFELDLAVLGIDGRPATPELWAAVLYERRSE